LPQPLNKTGSAKKDRKKKVAHEVRELLTIFLYLAFFFCALVTYSMLLLKEHHVTYLTSYAFAVINALVVAKVILIGDYMHLGKKYEARPLLQSAVVKAFLFSLLVLVFHIVEEVIKRMVHGADIASASRDIRIEELLARILVVFCTFIPLFGFRELRRVIGEEEFNSLVFRSPEARQAKSPH
jgi:hypothetical protein